MKEDHRKHLLDADLAASRDYDKTILALSSGALALSVSFVRFVAPEPDPLTTVWLKTSWLSFLLSMASILVSILLSQNAIKRAIVALDSGAGRADFNDILARGDTLSAEDAYWITAPTFATKATKYSWLNGVQAVGKMISWKPNDHVTYDIFVIK